jgi:hypothetical protein
MQRTAKRIAPIIAYAGLIASFAVGFLVVTSDTTRPHAVAEQSTLDLFSTPFAASALPPG